MEKRSTILEGEASESDEEVVDCPSFMQNTMVADASSNVSFDGQSSAKERISGVVVSGEASESDEEEAFDYSQPSGQREFPSLTSPYAESMHLAEAGEKNIDAQKSTSFRDEYKRPKFKSAFHKRFRENNFHVRCGIVDNTLDTYRYSTEKLKQCKPIASKTLESLQATRRDLNAALEALAVFQISADNLVASSSLPKFKKLNAAQ